MVYEHKIPNNKDAFISKLKSISTKLGIEPEWLMGVMNFETGGRFTSHVRNPFSQATGLIQFMPSTAIGLGVTIQQLAAMTNVEQLDYVYRYLKPYKGKMKSFTDVYLTVFYPYAVGKPDNYVIGSEKSQSRIASIHKQNSGFDNDFNGEITKKEIKAMLYSRMPEMNTYKSSRGFKNIAIISGSVLLIAGVIFYLNYKKIINLKSLLP